MRRKPVSVVIFAPRKSMLMDQMVRVNAISFSGMLAHNPGSKALTFRQQGLIFYTR
jgi:hypothetical protein